MTIQVFVHPNSKRPRVDTDLLGALHIYVNQPPLEGRANEAVIMALAEHFKIRKSQIKLIRGHKSKLKTFDLNLQK